MNKPSTLHKRVLRAITQQALEAQKLLPLSASGSSHGSEGAGNPAYHRVTVKIRELEAAAVAGGVPREWIEQTRYRGELGMAWRPDLHWCEHTPVDRPALLAALEHDVRHVGEIAAVAAAYGQRGARAEAGTAQLFARNLDTLARRVAAIAHLLNLSTDEAEQLWGRQNAWSAAADSVRAESEESLAERWRTLARLDTRAAARQVAALADAGIGAGCAGNPSPSAAQMVQRIQQLWEHTGHATTSEPAAPAAANTGPASITGSAPRAQRILFSAAQGDQITEFVTAVGLVEDFRPVFRSPADPKPAPPAAIDMGGLEP
ncbi:hypothetical protein [Nocardia vaccinii]|uniref:hypothetical protein n=1 Tax=Nocardia vaccinii TaxID=1822 RepID=UPI000831A09A|nr:hypothetical protein [Nocardia vaccinii]